MKTIGFKVKAASLVMAVILLLASGLSAANDPGNLPGIIVVDDKDHELVVTSFNGKSSAPEKPTEAFGGTVMQFGNWAQVGSGDKVVTVSASIPEAGLYQVWLRWVTVMRIAGGHAPSAPVKLTHADGEETFSVDMRAGNNWVLLGTYAFPVGEVAILEMSDRGARGLANFDALKLIPVNEIKPARPAPPAFSGGDKTTALRQAIRDLHVQARYGKGDQETDPVVLAKARRAELAARMHWDTMRDSFEGNQTLWSSVSGQHGSSGLTRTAGNLLIMAAAYSGATNQLGMDLRGNPELLAAILAGLEQFKVHYNDQTRWDVNWWDFEIGVPENLLPTLIVLGDNVPQDIRDHYAAAILHFTRDPRRFYNHGFNNSGANRLWASRIHVYLGAMENDPERVALASEAAIGPLRYVERDATKPTATPEGFYEDGSFVAHNLPFVAAYGALMLQAYSDTATVLKDTPWASDDPDADNAFSIMVESFDPFVVHGATVANVVGRSLGSANYEGNPSVARYLVAAAGLLPFAEGGDRQRLESLIKKWLEDDLYGELLDVALRQANIPAAKTLQRIAENDRIQPLPPQQGFRSFVNMDMATHRTDNVAAMLGMNSTRISNYESIWGANLRGWFQSEGILLLYTPEVGRYEGGYWWLVDPFRFPGITVERFPRRENDGSGGNPATTRGGSAFVGSLGLGEYGVATMHVKPRDGDLEARKSWFFFGDQIVNLGAGIGAKSEHTVETTVENTRRMSPSQTLVVDGKTVPEGEATWSSPRWAYLSSEKPGAGLGWVFLDRKLPLQTMWESRTGSQRDFNRNGSPAEITLDFATLWYDHGAGLNNGSYAYVTLLERDQAEVEAYAKQPSITVPVNTPQLQVARDAAAGVTGIVAWEPGEFMALRFDQPCLLLFKTEGSMLKLAVADPTMQLNQPLRLTIQGRFRPMPGLDPAVKVIRSGPLELEIDLSGRNGQPILINLGP